MKEKFDDRLSNKIKNLFDNYQEDYQEDNWLTLKARIEKKKEKKNNCSLAAKPKSSSYPDTT